MANSCRHCSRMRVATPVAFRWRFLRAFACGMVSAVGCRKTEWPYQTQATRPVAQLERHGERLRFFFGDPPMPLACAPPNNACLTKSNMNGRRTARGKAAVVRST